MAAVGLIVLVSVLIGIVAVLLVSFFTSGASGSNEPPTVDGGWRSGA
jgi:hypothetical protein